jgi:hypothetical protein
MHELLPPPPSPPLLSCWYGLCLSVRARVCACGRLIGWAGAQAQWSAETQTEEEPPWDEVRYLREKLARVVAEQQRLGEAAQEKLREKVWIRSQGRGGGRASVFCRQMVASAGSSYSCPPMARTGRQMLVGSSVWCAGGVSSQIRDEQRNARQLKGQLRETGLDLVRAKDDGGLAQRQAQRIAELETALAATQVADWLAGWLADQLTN